MALRVSALAAWYLALLLTISLTVVFSILTANADDCHNATVEHSTWYYVNGSLFLTRNTSHGSCPVSYTGYTEDTADYVGMTVNALTIGSKLNVKKTEDGEVCCTSNDTLKDVWLVLAIVSGVGSYLVLMGAGTVTFWPEEKSETLVGVEDISNRLSKEIEAGKRDGRFVITSVVPIELMPVIRKRHPKLILNLWFDARMGYLFMWQFWEDNAKAHVKFGEDWVPPWASSSRVVYCSSSVDEHHEKVKLYPHFQEDPGALLQGDQQA
jgi:hypothetical protein